MKVCDTHQETYYKKPEVKDQIQWFHLLVASESKHTYRLVLFIKMKWHDLKYILTHGVYVVQCVISTL